MNPHRHFACIAILLCLFTGANAQIDSASLQQVSRLLPDADFITIPSPREQPIKALDALPDGWNSWTAQSLKSFSGSARPGEYFVFQIGVLAHKHQIDSLSVDWTTPAGKSSIPKSAITCFNTAGVDFRGKAFKKEPRVRFGRIQPLWFGLQIPETASGTYRFTVTVRAPNLRPQVVNIELQVAGKVVENSGFDNGKTPFSPGLAEYHDRVQRQGDPRF